MNSGRRLRGWSCPAVVFGVVLMCSACGPDSGARTISEISAVLGPSENSVEADFARQLEQFAEGELRVQECMAAAGFRYSPRGATVVEIDGELAELPLYEYRERYGYGIATPRTILSRPNFHVDNSDDVRDQLAADAIATYERALYGARFGGSGAGCVAHAFSLDADGVYSKLDEAHARFRDESYGDGRLTTAWESWARCMDRAGYPYAQPVDIFEELTAQFESVNDSGSGDSAPAREVLHDRELAIAAKDVECFETEARELINTVEREWLFSNGYVE